LFVFTGVVEIVGAVGCTTGCVAVVVMPGFTTGFEFSGCPTGISQRWPGWPCAGFRPAVEVVTGGTVFVGTWLVLVVSFEGEVIFVAGTIGTLPVSVDTLVLPPAPDSQLVINATTATRGRKDSFMGML
jgi:hypothetical protein